MALLDPEAPINLSVKINFETFSENVLFVERVGKLFAFFAVGGTARTETPGAATLKVS